MPFPMLDVLGAIGKAGLETAGNAITTAMNNQANKELWREQVAYNTPANQMTRLRDAGLNPALVFGHGTPVNVASPAPSQQRAEVSKIDLADIQQVQTQQQSRSNMSKQQEVMDAQMDLLGANRDTAVLDVKNKTLDYAFRKDVLEKTGWLIQPGDSPSVIMALKGYQAIGDEVKDRAKQAELDEFAKDLFERTSGTGKYANAKFGEE